MVYATRAASDPIGHFIPHGRVVLQHPRHLMKRNACPVEDIGDLRHRTGRHVKPATRRSFSCGHHHYLLKAA